MESLRPSDLASTLTRLREDLVAIPKLGANDTLWLDEGGRYHSEPGCWGANDQVTIDADDLVTLDVCDQQWCDCGGWSRSSLAWVLSRARTMYEHIASSGSTGVGGTVAREESFEEVARLLTLAESRAYRVDGLEALYAEMRQSIDEALTHLKKVLRREQMWEAAAAQVVKIAVSASEGPLLQSWASSKLIGERSGVRAWLNEMFDEHVSAAIKVSPMRRYLVAVPLNSSAHVALWVSCDEIAVHGSWVVAEAEIPEVVAAGLEVLRGRCFELADTDGAQTWRVAAKLWAKNGQPGELAEALELARAVCRAPRGE